MISTISGGKNRASRESVEVFEWVRASMPLRVTLERYQTALTNSSTPGTS